MYMYKKGIPIRKCSSSFEKSVELLAQLEVVSGGLRFSAPLANVNLAPIFLVRILAVFNSSMSNF